MSPVDGPRRPVAAHASEPERKGAGFLNRGLRVRIPPEVPWFAAVAQPGRAPESVLAHSPDPGRMRTVILWEEVVAGSNPASGSREEKRKRASQETVAPNVSRNTDDGPRRRERRPGRHRA